METRKKKCQLCGYYTQPGVIGCPVCGWENSDRDENVINWSMMIEDPIDDEEVARKYYSLAGRRKLWKNNLKAKEEGKEWAYRRGPLPLELPGLYEGGNTDETEEEKKKRIDEYLRKEVHEREREFFQAAIYVYSGALYDKEDETFKGIMPRLMDGEAENMILAFEILAEDGEYAIESNIYLAQCYIYGHGVEKDYSKAAVYLEKAAKFAVKATA